MKKILIISIVIIIALVSVNFVTQHAYIPFVNEYYGQLYLSVFKKDGKAVNGIFDTNQTSVVASKNTPYLAVYFGDKKVGILNSTNDQLKVLGENSSNLPIYPFSPSGTKLVYSVVRDDMVFTSTSNNNFWYYYDLFVYDINSGNVQKITDKAKGYLLNIYDRKQLYGWHDDHTVIYNCDQNMTYGPQKTCVYNIDSGTTQTSPVATNLTNAGTNSPNIPTSYDFTLNDCFYNFEKQYCAYGVLRFKIWDSMLFQDIKLKMPNKEILLYRGRARVDSLYWTSDNHLYGIFQGKLLKLY